MLRFKSLTAFIFVVEIAIVKALFGFGLVQLNLIHYSFLCFLLVIMQVQTLSHISGNGWLSWKKVGVIIIISHLFSCGLSKGICLYLQNGLTIHEWLLNMLGLHDLLINIGAFLFFTVQSPSTTPPILSHMVLPENNSSGNPGNSSYGNSGGTSANNTVSRENRNNTYTVMPNGRFVNSGWWGYWLVDRMGLNQSYHISPPIIMANPISKAFPLSDGNPETIVPGYSDTLVKVVSGEILTRLRIITSEIKPGVRVEDMLIASDYQPAVYRVLYWAVRESQPAYFDPGTTDHWTSCVLTSHSFLFVDGTDQPINVVPSPTTGVLMRNINGPGFIYNRI